MVIGHDFHISTPPEIAAAFRRYLLPYFVRDATRKEGTWRIIDGDGWTAFYNGTFAEYSISEQQYEELEKLFILVKRASKDVFSRGKKEGKEAGKNALIMLNMGEMSEAEFLKF